MGEVVKFPGLHPAIPAVDIAKMPSVGIGKMSVEEFRKEVRDTIGTAFEKRYGFRPSGDETAVMAAGVDVPRRR